MNIESKKCAYSIDLLVIIVSYNKIGMAKKIDGEAFVL